MDCGGWWTSVDEEGRKRARHCDPRKAFIEKSRLDRILGATQLPGRYQESTFDNFDVEPGTKEAWEYCKALSRDPSRFARGALLRGNTGNGKTHLLAACVKARAFFGAQATFQNWPALLAALKSDWDKYDDVVKTLSAIPFLALDDVGAGRRELTDFDKDVFHRIIDARYNEMLTVVISTNFAEKDLAAFCGQRIFSRLQGLCKFIEVKGRDWRAT